MPLAKVAAKVMAGVSLAEQGYTEAPVPQQHSVKEAVFPFAKFAGIDVVLGPEMKSTGEVMGVAIRSPSLLRRARSQPAPSCPAAARSSSASRTARRTHVADLARRLEKLGFDLLATKGTAVRLEEAGIRVQTLMKIQEGHPNVVDYMIDGNLQLVINTPSGKGARTDEGRIRAAAVSHGISCITTLEGATAAVGAMEALRKEEMTVQAVQDRFPAVLPSLADA